MKEFINTLPEKFDEYFVVNGEVGTLESTGENGEPDMIYRCDKPVVTLYLDEESQELCMLHQSREDVSEIYDFEAEEEKDRQNNENTEEDKG